MLLTKICLTGGPCGGKSSAIYCIKKRLKKDGYNVIVISEAATELKDNGMAKQAKSDMDFAELIVDYQLKRELEAEKIANETDEKCVIISDRSAIEPVVYVGEEAVSNMLKKHNKSIKSVRDSYDLVLHLTTTAKGIQDQYTLENNKARTESTEEAIILDDKLLELWRNHPNRIIIKNSKISFKDKLDKVLGFVMRNIKYKEQKIVSNNTKYER